MSGLFPKSAPRWLIDPAVDLLARAGITPNMLTAGGVVGNGVAAVLCASGEFLPAGLVMLAFSLLDLLDGALARATGRATDFGSVFDAVMDRVSEVAVLFGLLIWFSDRGGRAEELLIFAALGGSMLVSYVRARAEIIGLRMREGIFTRAERVALLSAALILEPLWSDSVTAALWVLAIGTVGTAALRLALVWWQTKNRETDD